jgi:hypothetical protein
MHLHIKRVAMTPGPLDQYSMVHPLCRVNLRGSRHPEGETGSQRFVETYGAGDRSGAAACRQESSLQRRSAPFRAYGDRGIVAGESACPT